MNGLEIVVQALVDYCIAPLSWGYKIALLHPLQNSGDFSTSNQSSSTIATTTVARTTEGAAAGTLVADIQIGPLRPVCMFPLANGTVPEYISSIEVVVTYPDGHSVDLPVNWTFDGCNASGSVQASLAPGSYFLNLSSCSFMGCRGALPRSFFMLPGQTTIVDVMVNTGIA